MNNICAGAAAGRDSLADIAAGTEPDSAASSPTLARVRALLAAPHGLSANAVSEQT